MIKKLLVGIVALIMMLTATGCSSTPEALTFRPEEDDFKYPITLKYTVKDTEKNSTVGSVEYSIEKGTGETGSGTIDVIYLRSKVSIEAKVMETEVMMYPKSFQPIYCIKKNTDNENPENNWESKTNYNAESINIQLDAAATAFNPESTDGLTVPLSGVCYDSETILLLVRALDIEKGQNTAVQLMNTQTGISDSTVLSVNSEAQELEISGLNGSEGTVKYNCRQICVGSTSIVSRPVAYIWVSDDINRLPLKIEQVYYTYTLVEYTLS